MTQPETLTEAVVRDIVSLSKGASSITPTDPGRQVADDLYEVW